MENFNDSEKIYTIVINGKPVGPFTLEELQTKAIKPESFIRKPGMDDYKEAHEMPELRSYFGFKFQQVAPQYFASFDQRLVAEVIDLLIFTAFYVAIMFVLYAIAPITYFRILVVAAGPIIYLSKLIYGTFAEAGVKQSTWGKRLMNLKVTDEEGNRLNLAHSFGRNAAKIISNLTLCIGYVLAFFNKKQQCLHDLIAGTVVIKDRLL